MPDTIAAARDAVRALNKAIEILAAKSAGSLPVSDRDKIDEEMPDLKAQRARLQAAINANNAAALKAPTDAQVQAIKSAVTNLEAGTAANLTVTAIINAASGAAEVLLT